MMLIEKIDLLKGGKEGGGTILAACQRMNAVAEDAALAAFIRSLDPPKDQVVTDQLSDARPSAPVPQSA